MKRPLLVTEFKSQDQEFVYIGSIISKTEPKGLRVDNNNAKITSLSKSRPLTTKLLPEKFEEIKKQGHVFIIERAIPLELLRNEVKSKRFK